MATTAIVGHLHIRAAVVVHTKFPVGTMSSFLRMCFFVGLLVALIQSANSIKCMYCKSDLHEEACDAVGRRITCTEDNAYEHFRYLQRLNKDLEEPRRNEGYSCMKIKVGNHRLVKGCVYSNLPVCGAFRKRAKPCSTCIDDDCNTVKYRDFYLN